MAKIYGSRWQIRESLGRGGQAEVFLVDDLHGREPAQCVLKRILNPKRRARFVGEVTACSKLSHPNIMRVVDHSALESDTTADDRMYLVMPLMPAGDLEKRAAMYAGSIDTTLQVAAALAAGLSHAHTHGVIHRDVKPANILFAKENHVPVLSDFGICLLRDEPRSTELDEVVGPRAFMAPELEDGGRLDVSTSADVYSLGKVIYYMLSGGVILPRERLGEEQFDIFTGKGGRHLLLARLLDRMICAREKRIATMVEVAGELQRIQEWEQRQGAALSPRASTLLSTLLTDARATISIEEHNRRVYDEMESRREKVKGALSAWFDEHVNQLAVALTHDGVSSARPLTAQEISISCKKCERLEFYTDARQFADLECSRGLEFKLAGGMFQRDHRLLLNAYTLRRVTITMGHATRKDEVRHQPILFVPYYFGGANWQAFFASGPAAAKTKPHPLRPSFPTVGRASSSAHFVTSFSEALTLCVRSSVGAWPSDADAYAEAINAAVEIFLERVNTWSKGGFATLP